MDTYAMFDVDSDDESDESKDSDDEENSLVLKKFEVTMESASYHCGVIKDALQGLDMDAVSENQRSFFNNISDQISGSIDRVQFAVDNLYHQGVSEHDSFKQRKNYGQKLRRWKPCKKKRNRSWTLCIVN